VAEIQKALLAILSKSPTTRQEIRLLTGYNDRDIRQAIRDLRLQGMRIVTADNGGYFIAESEEGYLPFRNAMVSRVVKIMQVVNAMDRNLNGQVVLECTGAKNMEQ
jgi:biotin operon repressor